MASADQLAAAPQRALRSGVTFAAATAPPRQSQAGARAAPWCGDGVLDLTEECDDGNGSDSDACLNNCLQAVCGDGILRGGVEACDDGNARNDDGCLFGCAAARCGDGYIQAGVEICDDGNDIEDDGCSTRCTTDYFVKLPVR
jgi:cysteine-rich repeat protein